MSDVKSDENAAKLVPPSKPGLSKPMRIWPAILLLLAMLLTRNIRLVVSDLSAMGSMLSAMLPTAMAILLMLWWLFFSRVSWRERFIGIAIVLVAGAISVLCADSTMGVFGMIVFLIPYGVGVFATALTIVAQSKPKTRMIVAVIGAVIGFGFSDMIRVDGMTGDFRVAWLWRWELNGEERAQAEMAQRSSAGKQPVLVDEPITTVEWPSFRGPLRNANGPDVVIATDWKANPPREIWRIPVGPSWSSFSVAGRRIFTQEQRGDNEAVVCYNAETGDELWAREYESRFWEAIGGVGPRATPTIAGSSVYTMGSEGVVLKLDAMTGEIEWQRNIKDDAGRKPPEWGFSSSPLVVGNTVIVHAGGKDDKGMLAYDTELGEPKWSVPAGDHSYSSPQLATLGGKTGVLMLDNNGVRLHDAETGDSLWNYDWESKGYRALQPLVLNSTTLLITTGMNIGTRRVNLVEDGETLVGEEAWTSRGMKTDYNDYVAHKGSLYGFDGSIFACIDLATGDKQWKGGRYGNGQVLLLPKTDQLLVVTVGKTWNHPVLIGNRLFVRNGEEAVCLEMPTE
jgi:outer membrane protein assembly factor BamB